MGSLGAEFEAEIPAEKLGQLNLGPDGGDFAGVRSDHPISDWPDVLRKLGADPDKFEVVGDQVKVSSWQQSKRTDNGDRDIVTLYSYSGPVRAKRDAVDLPALYAEVRRSKPSRVKGATVPATLVVCWADIQTGKVDHLGGIRELLERLDSKRVALEKHLKLSRPERIVVADVGDIIEGIENTASQLATNGLSLPDQIDVAATEFWKTIRMCAKYAPVDVLSIPSNHAQLRRGKNLIGRPSDDWGLHISKRLEQQNESAGLEVTFHRSGEWDETLTFDIRGTRLGLAHGHQAGSPTRVIDWWTKLGHAGVLDCDLLLTGHFHFASVRPSGRTVDGKSKWHLQAPTIDNGSAWVRNKFGEDGDPALMVFTVTDAGFDLTGLALL